MDSGRLGGSDPTARLLQQARALIAARRFEDVLPLAARAAAASPEDAEPLCLQAQALLALGRHQEATKAADRALGLDANSEWPHRLRALSLSRAKRHRDAVGAALEAVRLSPASAAAHLVLADVAVSAKQKTTAFEAVSRLHQLAPGDASTWVVRSRYSILVRHWHDARDAARHALTLDPENYAAMNNLGVALQGMGQRAEAQQWFIQAAHLAPAGSIAQQNARRQVRTRRSAVIRAVIGASIFLFNPVIGGAMIASSVRYLTSLPSNARMNAYIRYENRRRLKAVFPPGDLAVVALSLAAYAGACAGFARGTPSLAIGCALAIVAAILAWLRGWTTAGLVVADAVALAIAVFIVAASPGYSAGFTMGLFVVFALTAFLFVRYRRVERQSG